MLYTYYRQFGNSIFVRYKTDDDPKTKNKVIRDYKPTLYIQSEEPTDVTSIYGQHLKPVHLESIKGAKQFAEQYKNVENFVIEGNSNYANQFMIELYDGEEPDYNENNIRIGALDIEVHSTDGFPHPEEAAWPFSAITIWDSIEDMFYVFGVKCHEYDTWKKEKSPEAVGELNVTYFEFETEENMARSFLSHMNDHQYDVTTGWNSESFDMPYIVNRCYKILGEQYTNKMLSPFNKITIKEIKGNFGKLQQKVDIVGLPHIDYLELYKKHTYKPRQSFKLDYIAHVELDERKLSYEEAGSLENLYETDYQLYIDYNIQDVNIIKRLDAKLGLFSLVYAMSYYTLSNFEDAMGTVKIWEQLVAKFLYNKGKAPSFRHNPKEERDFEGAFVKDVIPGRYNWVVSFDLNSLYPHIEMQWNIGPETHVPYHELPDELKAIRDNHTFDDLLNQKIDLSALKKYNVCMAANFEFYRLDQMSFFSEIKRDLYASRKKVKRQMLDAQSDAQKVKENKAELRRLNDLEAKYNNLQLGLKVLLNGGYGALANKHFLYYMVENAEAITLSGQLVNRFTSSRLENSLKEMFDSDQLLWAAGDTDSAYISIEPFMDTVKGDIQERVDMADRFCNEIMSPMIDDLSQNLCDYVNGYEQKMKWEREVIAETSIWVAKKKYAMNVWDSEGVRFTGKPKMKLTGLESVKSITPEWSKKLLEACYQYALNGDQSEMYSLIESTEEEFKTYDVNDIAIPSGVNGIDKYHDEINLFKSGTPKHVKAVLVHNMMLKTLGINTIEPITDGSKIKWVELKMPNPTGQPVVAFDTYLPKEFGLNGYINRDAILERSFKKPLKIFLDAIGWEPEETVTLF